MAKTKKEIEIVMAREDRLDNVYFECLEIMRMPEKWAIDKDGKIITVYPHPIVSREAYKVDGIKYLPHKIYSLPPVLLEREKYWAKILKSKKAPKERKEYRKNTQYSKTPEQKLEDARKWAELRKQGLTFKAIGEIAGVTDATVIRYVKKYEEANINE